MDLRSKGSDIALPWKPPNVITIAIRDLSLESLPNH
ncbi:MAG: hypothetical protein JWR17_19 [Pseudomonas sp.]|nr:hypothetical protein [Pseudomonas sp.]